MKPKPKCRTKSSSASGKSTSKKHLTHRKGAYVVYKMHEDILNQRYHESVQTVLAELKKVIPRIELTGQWSVDVMRNGNDYYIIDMALAENSALNDCVPKNLLRAYPQQWLPGESNS